MQIIEMQLHNFFLTYLDSYVHNNGVAIVYSLAGSTQVSCEIPGLDLPNKDMTVELFSEHDTLIDFISEYLITDLSDLELITPALMLKRFMVGRCDLFCYLDPEFEYFLSFRRKGDHLIAKDSEDNLHTVLSQIKTPKEIIVYTQHYFEKLLA